MSRRPDVRRIRVLTIGTRRTCGQPRLWRSSRLLPGGALRWSTGTDLHNKEFPISYRRVIGLSYM
jgi:hypothetical protein